MATYTRQGATKAVSSEQYSWGKVYTKHDLNA